MLDTLLAIHWTVDPDIVTLGPLKLRWYGLLFISGFILGFYLTRKTFQEVKAPEPWLDSLLIYLILGTIIGARLGHVIFYDPQHYFLEAPEEIIMIWKGGLASHGGVVGVILGFWLFSKRISKKPFFWITDKVVMSGAFAAGFIRLGNLMNSEIVGNPTGTDFGFIFAQRGEDFARHPAQLYEAFAYFLIGAILLYLFWKTDLKKRPGFLSGLFLVMLFSARFLIEFVKIPQEKDYLENLVGSLTMGQLLSIPFILVGIYFMAISKKQES